MSRSKYLTMLSSATLTIAAGAMLQGCEGLVDAASRAGLPVQDSAPVTIQPQPSVDLTQAEHTVSFPAGSTTLSSTAGQGLLAFLNKIGLARSDRVSIVSPPLPVSASNSQRLATARREQAVSALLDRNDVAVAPLPADVATVPPTAGTVTVLVRRYIVRLPSCPNWTSSVWDNYDNQPGSNWGCATAVNFGMMVADPADLIAGRDEPIADGTVQARSVARYRAGDTKDLIRDSAASDTFNVNISDGGE